MPKRMICSAQTIAIAALVAIWSLAATADEAPLGIAAEPPTDGPTIKIDGGYMVAYTGKIPGSDVTFEMVPIPRGKFTIGSPATEANRKADEGPQVEIEVAPFWMGKYEVTLGEYKQYMKLENVFSRFQDLKIREVTEKNGVDAVTAPSRPYDPKFYFLSGDDPQLPAASMSQYAARQYTKWLSLLTGHSYRIPSEAEWEYACRAGTTNAYSFGDDPKDFGEHGFHYDNSNDLTQLVGQLKANLWGLHDMHGNVAEWTLDAYTESGYEDWKGKSLTNLTAVHWPTSRFPRVARGGSIWFDPEDCRSSTRLASNDEWLNYDPDFIKSPWWTAEDLATTVGMRVVRVPEKFSAKQQKRYWEAETADLAHDIQDKIREGRGERGIVDPSLPDAIKKLPKEE